MHFSSSLKYSDRPEQKLLQDLMQKLLPDLEAPVQAEAPVYAGAHFSAESYVWSYRAILIKNQY